VTDDPIEQYGALFERDGTRIVPTPLTRGPWDPRAMHGGAPSALFAAVCEAHDPGPASFVARLTVELLRPVPIAPLELKVHTFRPGEKVQWIEAMLLADDQEVSRATVLRLHNTEIDIAGTVSPELPAPPGPDAAYEPAFPAMPERAVGFWICNEVRLVSGTWLESGPAVAWFRLKCPVFAGEPITPMARVASCADFGSGVGNPVRMTNAAAINPELTVHVHRYPVGEWVCLESGGYAQPHGAGLADTLLHDEHGPIGRGCQTLLVDKAEDRIMKTNLPNLRT
jgi:hypothetical protein